MTRDRDRKKRNWRAEYRPYIIAATLAIILFVLVAPALARGNEMADAIEAGDIVIIDRETYSERRGLPDYGDIVAFKRDYFDGGDETKNHYRMSRIVGLPGDTIEIKDGAIYRNGKALKREVYEPAETESGEMNGPVSLKDDEVFVLSDNRAEGIDSRRKAVGPRTLDELRGRVAFRIWPLKRFGFVE
ncbi:MAG: signal peptidase I [Clostridiales Family XIII bacterium]|jgi:signal peptidase I|nr:signal peptidase I [Clostridiales Family XIII bacterium]